MSRGGAEHAEKIARNEHCNWPSAVTAAPRDQVFQLSNSFRAPLGVKAIPTVACAPSGQALSALRASG
jgi:hypothetical protein